MGSNRFGTLFQVTTFGESHGSAIGAVIDGCPAGLVVTQADIESELARRQPGLTAYTSARKEPDSVEILSGVLDGVTTGAPIALLIRNRDVDSSAYEPIKHLYRPGHANFTYLEKYGVFDHRGGGRASARETAARVAAGAVAKKLLAHAQIECVAFLAELGGIAVNAVDLSQLRENALFCPDASVVGRWQAAIEQAKDEGDSVGGIVGCTARVPAGLGDPVYNKLEAMLSYAMLSIPASKGFEIGAGFQAARMRGSEHNDSFGVDETGKPRPLTNHAGGTLGGISTGEPLEFRVAFKPTSSIRKAQATVDVEGRAASFALKSTARHDPCVAIRAVPVVEAMCALVLADAWLMQRLARM